MGRRREARKVVVAKSCVSSEGSVQLGRGKTTGGREGKGKIGGDVECLGAPGNRPCEEERETFELPRKVRCGRRAKELGVRFGGVGESTFRVGEVECGPATTSPIPKALGKGCEKEGLRPGSVLEDASATWLITPAAPDPTAPWAGVVIPLASIVKYWWAIPSTELGAGDEGTPDILLSNNLPLSYSFLLFLHTSLDSPKKKKNE